MAYTCRKVFLRLRRGWCDKWLGVVFAIQYIKQLLTVSLKLNKWSFHWISWLCQWVSLLRHSEEKSLLAQKSCIQIEFSLPPPSKSCQSRKILGIHDQDNTHHEYLPGQRTLEKFQSLLISLVHIKEANWNTGKINSQVIKYVIERKRTIEHRVPPRHQVVSYVNENMSMIGCILASVWYPEVLHLCTHTLYNTLQNLQFEVVLSLQIKISSMLWIIYPVSILVVQ